LPPQHGRKEYDCFGLSAFLFSIAQLKLLNLREKVVNNVELDDTVEQLTANESKVSVDSGQSTLLKSPGALLEVLGLAVVVVKVSDGDYTSLVIIPIKLGCKM
jgi:hypothetical protein